MKKYTEKVVTLKRRTLYNLGADLKSIRGALREKIDSLNSLAIDLALIQDEIGEMLDPPTPSPQPKIVHLTKKQVQQMIKDIARTEWNMTPTQAAARIEKEGNLTGNHAHLSSLMSMLRYSDKAKGKK